jgi:heme/copper-type cytochrome/quinol oxidase subunit 4
MTTAEGSGMKKYVAVYVVLLVLTAVQFATGYQNIEGGRMVVRFLTFGVIESLLVIIVFMNLGSENRAFLKFIVPFTLFVLATINYGWTDSFRMLVFRLTGVGPS